MFRSGVRYFCSKVSQNQNQSQRPTKIIEGILREHGPQTVNDCWKFAQPAGIKSKTHMKTMLHWLVEKDRVKIKCNHLKHISSQKKPQQKGKPGQQRSGQGAKEFLFGIKEKTKKPIVEGSVADDVEVQATLA